MKKKLLKSNHYEEGTLRVKSISLLYMSINISFKGKKNLQMTLKAIYITKDNESSSLGTVEECNNDKTELVIKEIEN